MTSATIFVPSKKPSLGVLMVGVAEVGAVGIVVFAVVLDSSGIYVAKEINV